MKPIVTSLPSLNPGTAVSTSYSFSATNFENASVGINTPINLNMSFTGLPKSSSLNVPVTVTPLNAAFSQQEFFISLPVNTDSSGNGTGSVSMTPIITGARAVLVNSYGSTRGANLDVLGPCTTPTKTSSILPSNGIVNTALSFTFNVSNTTSVVLTSPATGWTAALSGNTVTLSGTPSSTGVINFVGNLQNACGGNNSTTTITGVDFGSVNVTESGGSNDGYGPGYTGSYVFGVSTNRTHTCRIRYLSDGDIEVQSAKGNAGLTSVKTGPDWYSPLTTNIKAGYKFRVSWVFDVDSTKGFTSVTINGSPLTSNVGSTGWLTDVDLFHNDTSTSQFASLIVDYTVEISADNGTTVESTKTHGVWMETEQ